MRIGINARGLAGSGGTSVYLENIISEIVNQNTEHEIFVFRHDEEVELPADENLNEIRYRHVNPVFDDHLIIHYLFMKHDIDLGFFPKNVIPFLYSGESVVTVHDLGYFQDEDFYPLVDRIYQKRAIKRGCKRADRIIAVSKNTKKDIEEFLQLPKQKIEVIYHGVNNSFFEDYSNQELNEFKQKRNLGDKIIYGGNLGRRKNYKRLIEVFESLENGYELVYTGNSSESTDEYFSRHEDVKTLGYIEREEMPMLLQSADLMVYPSLYEGFGLPLLEAMAAEVPVVCSDCSSLPEVTSEAAIRFDPEDTEEIAESMSGVLNEQDVREKLVSEGKDNLTDFSWQKSAKKTLEVFESVFPG